MEMIIHILKKLREAEPGKSFAAHSLELILSAPQNKNNNIFNRFIESLQYSGAVVMASVLLIVFLGGISTLKSKVMSPAIMANLDYKKINEELNNLNFQIKLSEVKYYEDSFNKISVALNETSKNGPGHLNESVIQKEADKIDNLESDTKKIDDLLNELVL